jgi:hypothetical protein
MNLSLSFCSELASPPAPAQALWHQLNATAGVQPELNGHHALTTVFEETEWMIITGGEADHVDSTRFHVWLMNLTHVDLVETSALLLSTTQHSIHGSDLISGSNPSNAPPPQDQDTYRQW